MNEELGVGEQDVVEKERVIAWGEKAIRGEFLGDLGEYEDVGETVPVEGSEGESDVLDGVVLDMNDKRINDSQKEDLRKWIEAKLEFGLSEAPRW